MSSHHRAQVQNRRPDLDSVRAETNRLRHENQRLQDDLQSSRRNFNTVQNSVGRLRDDVASVRQSNYEFGQTLERTQGRVSQLAAEQQSLRNQSHRIERNLATTNRSVSALKSAQQSLQNEMSGVRREQRVQQRRLDSVDRSLGALRSGQQRLREDLEEQRRETRRELSEIDNRLVALGADQQELRREVEHEREVTRAHLRNLDQSVGRLGASQAELRRDFEQQRQATRQELDCLHDSQQSLSHDLNICQQDIHQLEGLTSDLQRQQNQTVEMLNEVARYSRQVHQQLVDLENVVEERHRQAMEDLERKQLKVVDARQLAEANLGLLDRGAVTRFGMQADYEELENLLHQAHGHGGDSAVNSAALALYVSASEKAIHLRRRLQDVAREQTVREQRIQHRLSEVARVADAWESDEYIAFHREAVLQGFRERRGLLEERVEQLRSTTSYRDLTEETAAVDHAASSLNQEAQRCDQADFPELVRKCKERDRFINAIYQGIIDTFRRQGIKAEPVADLHLADEQDRESNIRFAAGSGARTVVVEVGLDGDCHFWWEGYPEKTHVRDIEEFENVLRQGRELDLRLTSSRTFRGEPKYDPPPDFRALRPGTGTAPGIEGIEADPAVREQEMTRNRTNER